MQKRTEAVNGDQRRSAYHTIYRFKSSRQQKQQQQQCQYNVSGGRLNSKSAPWRKWDLWLNHLPFRFLFADFLYFISRLTIPLPLPLRTLHYHSWLRLDFSMRCKTIWPGIASICNNFASSAKHQRRFASVARVALFCARLCTRLDSTMTPQEAIWKIEKFPLLLLWTNFNVCASSAATAAIFLRVLRCVAFVVFIESVLD